MKKNWKKGVAVVLALVMMLCAVPAMAFAETAQEPNFYGDVSLDNWACEEFESLEELSKLPLTLTVTSETDASESVSFRLKYNDDFSGFVVEDYENSAEMTAIMERIFQNQKAVEKAWLNGEMIDETYFAAVFDGYDVVMNLREDCHWTAELYEGGVTTATNKDIILEFESSIELIVELYNAFAEELGEEPIVLTEETRPQTVEEFALLVANLGSEEPYDSYEDALRDPANEYTEEEIQELLADVQEQDAALAAARAKTEEYPIDLYVSMLLCCDCLWSYQIGHCYMVEKDGKLESIDLVWESKEDEGGDAYLKAPKGTLIQAEDYLELEYNGTVEAYAGESFVFTGSYDTWWDPGVEDWTDYALEENQFTLGNPEYDGMILTYVLEEKEAVELEVVVEETYTAGSGEDFVVTGNGDYKDFLGILVDGKMVETQYYTVEKGSTIVTLQAAYMDTLEPGEHRVKMIWTTGMAEKAFRIVKAEAFDEKNPIKEEADQKTVETVKAETVKGDTAKADSAPQTGDHTPVGMYIALLVTAVCAVGIVFILKRRNK